MGLNMDKIKRRQEELNKPRGGNDYDFWTPQPGRNVIRVCPPKGDKETFWAECDVHYNVGPDNKMVVCLGTFGKPCPVCEAVEELESSGNKDDKALASKMRYSHKVYLNVIDREGEEESDSVKVLGCGNSIFKEILNLICDPDYGDITDIEEGYDLIITKKGKGLKTEYTVNAKPKQTPTSDDLSEEELQEALIDLDTLVVEKTYAEITAILYGEDSDDDDDEDEDEDEDDEDNEDTAEDEDEDEEEEEEEDEAPKKSKASKSSKPSGSAAKSKSDGLRDEIQNALKNKKAKK